MPRRTTKTPEWYAGRLRLGIEAGYITPGQLDGVAPMFRNVIAEEAWLIRNAYQRDAKRERECESRSRALAAQASQPGEREYHEKWAKIHKHQAEGREFSAQNRIAGFVDYAIGIVSRGDGIEAILAHARDVRPREERAAKVLSMDEAAEKLAVKIEQLIDFDRAGGQGNALVQDFRFLEMIKGDLSDRAIESMRGSIKATVAWLNWWRSSLQPKAPAVKKAKTCPPLRRLG